MFFYFLEVLTAAEKPKVAERPALPFPPGVTVESQCGAVDDLQDVELYDGALNVSKEYVAANEPSTVQLQWLDEASIRSRLKDHFPGNISGERWCTGTLITDRLVLTAGHCFDVQKGEFTWITPFELDQAGKAKYADSSVLAQLQVANFGFQVDRNTGAVRIPDVYPVVSLVEYRLGGLDYAIVELGKNAGGHLPGERIAPAVVVGEIPKIEEILGIIQHPQGLPKKVGAGHLLSSIDQSIYYNDIDTWGGSSGSGVRNPDGKIIGVHTNGGCELGSNTGANRGVDINAIIAVSNSLKK